jgi:hypothetical protein
MDKLIVHIFLWLFIDDKNKLKRAMDILFGNEEPKVVTPEVIVKPKPVNNKRDEVMDAIKYLKSKSTKTKQDREKIQMLEVILKSGRFGN